MGSYNVTNDDESDSISQAVMTEFTQVCSCVSRTVVEKSVC